MAKKKTAAILIVTILLAVLMVASIARPAY